MPRQPQILYRLRPEDKKVIVQSIYNSFMKVTDCFIPLVSQLEKDWNYNKQRAKKKDSITSEEEETDAVSHHFLIRYPA
jgi:hypothetical protein